MTVDEYMKERVEDQIAWYEGKSQCAKRGYLTARTVEVVVAASIPGLIYLWDWEYTRMVIVFLSASIVAINGLLGIYRWGDLWKNYRTISETLKHHRSLFNTKCSPYDGEDPFCLFVRNVEQVISDENSDWRKISFEKTKDS